MVQHMQLSDYGMSRARGFLSHYEIDQITLPAQFAGVTQAAGNLSGLLTTGRIRHWLDQLPDPGLEQWAIHAPQEEVRTAMVHYSFLVQAYVWGEPAPPAHLPANLARPIVALADRLDQAPLLPYSGYVLDNWARIDKSGPIALDNIRMVQNFLGGADENWFVMVHVAIEAEAGVLLGRSRTPAGGNGCRVGTHLHPFRAHARTLRSLYLLPPRAPLYPRLGEQPGIGGWRAGV
jgi:indoleamine 2,3-dioxygenase